jgi:hypothetical protein
MEKIMSDLGKALSNGALFRQIFQLVGILLVLAICVILLRVSYVSVKRIRSLSQDVERMVKAQKTAYPNEELPPVLRQGEDGPQDWEEGHIQWQLSPESRIRRENVVLDPEEEYPYPYYRRTKHLVGSVQNHSLQSMRDGSWYGFDEWVQDMICGKVDVDAPGEHADKA